ncbi:restriction endonuclease subunit S [Streptococcus oralis]|jgi:type I restriction enzyme, S subunit|uniref:restriction endonuclease subunit S n=1 Tax=Streptococcus oralis TaxID=1303 RepID=UPI001BD5F875|nr:restriction endonuclease subunit S [Streptococcus oralis]MBS9400719.1 restriction endonuclease subunit S [Streptococcus oralis]MCY7087670.1 restriction endonuclease subunit S [Streptococcus oralis]
MSKWRKKQLQEIAFLRPTETLKKGDIAPNIPMANIKEFQRDVVKIDYSEFRGGTKFRNGDTLLAKITPCLENGKTAFVNCLQEDEIGFGSTEFIVLRAKENIDERFLYYLSISPEFRKQAISLMEGTSGRKRVNENALKISDFLIPDFEEQRKIANILSAIDDKIQINNQINQELEAMAKTLYDYWFVQFDFPDQNGKPYKSSGGKMVYHPELKREIPEGWGVESVGNLLDKVTKAEKIENNLIEFIGEIPVIDQSQKYIAGFTNNENGLIQPQKGHVIFGDHTRVVKYINFDYARGADGTQVLISKNEHISNVLLYHMIEDFDLSNYGYARHFKFLKEKIVIVPDKEVSSKFETQANVIYEKIKNNIFENQELTRLRDWLLPMLMNGQVKVE